MVAGRGASAVWQAVFGVLLAGVLLADGNARAETLRVGLRELTSGMGNPFSASVAAPGILTWSAVYEQLTRNDASGAPHPLLAASWRNIDPTTWEFRLRRNIAFSNGESFNAWAAEASWDFVLKTDEGRATSAGKTVAGYIADVVVISRDTIQVKTHRPQPLTPKLVQPVSILPPRALADEGLASFATNGRGTGPYVASYRQDRVTGTPNPAWRDTRGNVDRIEWIVLEDDAVRLQALLSGQVDIDVALGLDSVPQARAAGLEIVARRAPRTLGLSLVTWRRTAPGKPSEPVKGPLTDVRVRRALNHAVNKQSIVDTVFGGNGAPATQSAPSVVKGYNPTLMPYAYDPARAKALLAEAGHANGFDLEVRAVMPDAATSQTYQAAVQDLNRIGVKAKLIPMTFAEYIDNYLKGNWPYDAFGFGHNLTATLDASQAFLQLTSCKKNPPYYCNREEMPLVEQLEVEFDEPKRIALLHKALEVQRNNAPIIYLVEFDEVMGNSPKVQGFDQINQWIAFEKISVKR